MNATTQQTLDFDRRPGRPLMGRQRRVTIATTMDPEIADRISKIAYQKGFSRSSFLEMLATQAIEIVDEKQGGPA